MGCAGRHLADGFNRQEQAHQYISFSSSSSPEQRKRMASPGDTRARQQHGSAPLPKHRGAARVPLLSGAPGRPERLFPLKPVTRRDAGEDLAGHGTSALRQASSREDWLPSLQHMALPPLRAPQPSRQAPTISRPPSQPNPIVPGRCLLPPPHLSPSLPGKFSPPPPGSSRSHNSILFMETNCPAGGCT